ncbi:hypothetical protein F4861DRAFT_497364 [Xylaria intraflava]|nr:hypothetical protein F4861DRAFT_497364 [Xylaria intraflava]
MRFTSFIVAGLFAIVASAQSSVEETGSATSSVASTTAASIDPAQSSEAAKIDQCLASCDASDTKCRANCIAVPSPDNANVNATTTCVAACPQGSGTPSDNQAYANCVNGCIAQFYFTSTGTPNLATSNAGNSAGASVTNVQTTITSGGSTFVTDVASTKGSSETAHPSTTSSKGGAAVYGPVGTGLGLFGLLAGFIAL